MAKDDPIDLRQDRRQWLKTSATVLGASLLPLPAVTAETPQAQTAPAAPETKPAEPKSAGRFFPSTQHVLVDELSDAIIPADGHSRRPKAAKVADYIDQFLRESYDDPQ